MTHEIDLYFEPKPIEEVCEAIAYQYAQQLPDDIREALAEPDAELVHTLFNLIELKPAPAVTRHVRPGEQLTLAGPIQPQEDQ